MKPLFRLVSVATASVALATSGFAAPATDQYIYVVVHDRKLLTDPARDELSRLVVVRPALNLASLKGYKFPVKCKSAECSLDVLVDKYYDYYTQHFASTTAAITDWIKDANKLVGDSISLGSVVQFPAIPVKANEIFSAAGVRSYNAKAQTYLAGTGVDSLSHFDNVASTVAKRNDVRRAVNETISRYTLKEYVAAFGGRPPAQGFADVYLGGADPRTGSLVQLHLLSDSTPATTVNFESPYGTLWADRWHQEDSPSRRAELAALAIQRPLVIVDWDFAGGHGRKVAAVVKALLREWHLDFLGPAQFDLDPEKNAPGLIAAMDEYCAYRNEKCTEDGSFDPTEVSCLQAQYRAAIKWIRNPDIQNGETKTVDGFVLKTALWSLFRTGAWLNLSFQVAPSEANVLLDQVLEDSPAMAFVAAGNDPAPVLAAFFPQSIARLRPGRFINVTFGSPDGAISGSYSMIDPAQRTDVALVTKGSGFVDPDVPPESQGSSYASPIVSAATWVLSLLRPSVDNSTVLRVATEASRPLLKLQHPVRSGGFFDPYLLLVGAGRRMLGVDGTVHAVDKGDFNFTYVNPVDGLDNQGQVRFDGSMTGMIRIYRDAGTFRLWRRRLEAVTGDPTIDDVLVQNGTATFLLDGNQQTVVLTLDDLADKYREISF